MQWRLVEGALEAEAEVDAVAREVADAIDTLARAASRTPSPADQIVVFEDEAAWRASYLGAVAHGISRAAWYFARLQAEGEPPGALGQTLNVVIAREVVLRLARDGVLLKVLQALRPSAIEALAGVVCSEEEASAPFGRGEAAWEMSTVQHELDGVGQLLAFVQAARVVPPRQLFDGRWLSARSRDSHEGSTNSDESGVERSADPSVGENVEHATPSGSHDAGTQRVISSGDKHQNAALSTSFGGLFYLLNATLELGAGEILWKACLPEKAIFARVAASWLGSKSADDPAVALFAGAEAHEPCGSVSHEMQREVALSLLDALVTALPRRGLADFPATTIAVRGTQDRRYLVVASGPFALFCASFVTSSEAIEGLQAFLDRWPRSAPPPRATPALVGLDPSGRLYAESGERRGQSILLPEAPDPAEQMLLAQVAGAIANLFAHRTGFNRTLGVTAFEARHLAVPALVELAEASMCIRMPMERIDIDVRLAGLDRDPGWVPWLQRKVAFTFVSS
jgi:hypothetical protein